MNVHQDGETEYFCGGVLISPDLVISASHCFDEINPKNMIVLLGAHNISKSKESSRIAVAANKLIINEGWLNRDTRRRFNDDIAIIKLEGSVEFTNYIRPICIVNPKQKLNRKQGVVCGWGITQDGNQASDIARKLDIPIVGNEKCYRDQILLAAIGWEKSFCAGRKGFGVCSGDSGSGFYVNTEGRFYLKGIVSSTINGQSCNGDFLAIYTDVEKYSGFLKKNGFNHFKKVDKCRKIDTRLPNSIGEHEVSENQMEWFVKINVRSSLNICSDGTSDCAYPVRRENREQKLTGIFLSNDVILSEKIDNITNEMFVDVNTSARNYTKEVSKVLKIHEPVVSDFTFEIPKEMYSLIKLKSPIKGIHNFPCVPLKPLKIEIGDNVMVPKFGSKSRKMVTVEVIDDNEGCSLSLPGDFCIKTPYKMGRWSFIEVEKTIQLVGLMYDKIKIENSRVKNYHANVYNSIAYKQDEMNKLIDE